MPRLARTHQFHQWTRWLPATVSTAVIAIIASQPLCTHAQVDVSAIYTQSGGLFNYNFSVLNTGPLTTLFVDLAIPASFNPTNLSAGPGFQTVYDSGLGLVTFLPANPLTNGEFTTGNNVSGFRFSSTNLLTGTQFTATDEVLGTTTGTVRLTAASSAAPEPGTLGFIALAGVPFAAVATRRRFATSRSLKG